jgi:multidrug efflux system outer membrane protein
MDAILQYRKPDDSKEKDQRMSLSRGSLWRTSLVAMKWLSVFGILAGTSAFPFITLAADKVPDAKSVLQEKKYAQIQEWKAAPATELGTTVQQDFPRIDWWQSFNDPYLTALIEKALAQNPALKALKWQVKSASANAKISRAALMPKASFSPNYTIEKLGLNQYIFPINGRNFQVYQLPITASYEADIWGKNLAGYRSAKKGIRIAMVQYEAAQIQLASAVATAYFNIAKWRQMEALAQEELESSRKLLSHSQGLLDLGQATTFDIQNSQQRRDLAQVNVSQYANNRELAENQLLNLLGEIPSAKAVINVADLNTLTYPKSLDTGVPSELILHRPDIAISELQLSAARLDIAAARKAMLPSLILNGSSGPFAVGLNNLFKWTSLSSFALATLSQPVFQGGRLRAELNLRKANYQQLIHNYENTLVGAFTEAENSLATLHANQVVYRDITNQTNNAREKAKVQQARYQAGIEGEPLWLAEDVLRLEYEKQLAQQKAQILIDVVSVAKAMGGGFN